MNFNGKSKSKNNPTQEPKKNHTKTIIGIIILAIIIVAVTIMALQMAHNMNDVVSPWSSIDKPVSVLDAIQNR